MPLHQHSLLVLVTAMRPLSNHPRAMGSKVSSGLMGAIIALTIYTVAISYSVTFSPELRNPFSMIDAANPCNSGAPWSTTRTSQARSGGMFDIIQERMFRNASAYTHVPRRDFSLEKWELQSDGGLEDDDRILLGNLYRNATSVFEFGLGESTSIAAHVGVPRYAGVDSDAAWVEKARKQSDMTHFRFIFADIGESVGYGSPKDESLKKIAYNYQIAPLAGELEPFDVYLVDGRYRVACACTSLLHAIRHGGDMSKIMVAIHDYDQIGNTNFFGVQRDYDSFSALGTIIHRSSRLAVFKMKNTVREDDIRDLWERKFYAQA